MEEENMGSFKQQLSKLFEVSLGAVVPDESNLEPLVAACAGKFGDYQCDNAMSLRSRMKGNKTEFRGPPSIGQVIMKNLPQSEMIESFSVAGPGFVNVVLSNKWMAKSIQKMLTNGIGAWAPGLKVNRAVVDFSSPNISTEMDVGHLRSTIIGDTLAVCWSFQMLKFFTETMLVIGFGMLIEFLFEEFPNWEDAGGQAIGDLQEWRYQG